MSWAFSAKLRLKVNLGEIRRKRGWPAWWPTSVAIPPCELGDVPSPCAVWLGPSVPMRHHRPGWLRSSISQAWSSTCHAKRRQA